MIIRRPTIKQHRDGMVMITCDRIAFVVPGPTTLEAAYWQWVRVWHRVGPT